MNNSIFKVLALFTEPTTLSLIRFDNHICLLLEIKLPERIKIFKTKNVFEIDINTAKCCSCHVYGTFGNVQKCSLIATGIANTRTVLG